LPKVTILQPVGVANELRPTLLKLARALRREAHLHGVTAAQAALLGAVDAYPDYGVKELAAREGISPPAITRNLDRLEEAGLIDRSRSTSDARRITLAVTPKGRTTLRSIRSQRTALLVSMLAELSPDELEQVAEANEALKRIIPEG
jgi:DNA-binding MarR family transcriptional regulator